MTTAAHALSHALAQLLEQERAPESLRTAQVFREMGPRSLAPPLQTHPLVDDIRRLLATSTDPKLDPIQSGFDLIPWGISPVSDLHPEGVNIYCVATLLGPEGPIDCPDLRAGLFYQRPGMYYKLHNHLADETYTLLAGSALWTAGDDTRLRHAGECIHHPSLMPHAFKTGPDGLLALWRWSGDVDPASYQLLDDPSDA